LYSKHYHGIFLGIGQFGESRQKYNHPKRIFLDQIEYLEKSMSISSDMLEDGFKSNRYGAILGNLRDNGYLDESDVDILLKNFISTYTINFDRVSDTKAKIVTEALIDNYHRIKGGP